MAAVRAMAIIHSPHVVRYFSSWAHGDTVHMQMELCDGTVADLAADHTAASATGAGLPVATVRAILRDMLAALTACHAAGVAHLDVKPDNMLHKDGVYKLADFGRAAMVDDVCPEEGDGRYMAPELLREDAGVEAPLSAADMFSLGVSMCELAAGAARSALASSAPYRQRLRRVLWTAKSRRRTCRRA